MTFKEMTFLREKYLLPAAFAAVFLFGMVFSAFIGGLIVHDPTPKVLEAYKQGRQDALTIKRGNSDLEMTCAALWQSKQPFLGDQK